MKIEIEEDIEDVLPKYVLMKDGTLFLESSSQKRTGRIGALISIYESFLEGAVEIMREKKKLKRNVGLRVKAIEQYGLNCYVCGLNFEDRYGNYGAGYIELHHLRPLADSKGERGSTVKDVRVVCSNCHSVLHHLGKVPLDVDELKAFIKAISTT